MNKLTPLNFVSLPSLLLKLKWYKNECHGMFMRHNFKSKSYISCIFFSIENISLNAFSKIKIYKGGKYTNIRDLNIEKHTDE